MGEDILLLRDPAAGDHCRRRFPDLTLWTEREISALPEDPGLVWAAWLAKKQLGGRVVSDPKPGESADRRELRSEDHHALPRVD